MSFSNPDAIESATVNLEVLIDAVWEPLYVPFDVPPLGADSFVIPDNLTSAVRITSDRPVSAQQIGAVYDDDDYADNMALAMLYATPTWGWRYHTVGQPGTFPSPNISTGTTWVQLVALNPGTTVTIDTPIDLRLWGEATLAAGGSAEYELEPGEVYLMGQSLNSDPIAGIGITSDPDHPFAVVVSHSRARYPADGSHADMIMEQLLPVGAWGTEYVAVPPRGVGQSLQAIWQIVAHENDTSVSFDVDGADLGLPALTDLGAGDVLEFTSAYGSAINGAFKVSATKPIGLALLGHSSYGGNMLVSVPPIVNYTMLSTGQLSDWSEDFAHYGIITSMFGPTVQINGGQLPAANSYDIFNEWTVNRYDLNHPGTFVFEADQPYYHLHQISQGAEVGYTSAAFEVGQ